MMFSAWAAEPTIPEGVYVGDVSLGGMTKEEARQAIDDRIEEQAGRQLELDVGGEILTAQMGDMGLSWSNEDELAKELEKLSEGNLIERYMAAKDLQKDPLYIDLDLEIDGGYLAVFLEGQETGLSSEPQNATITRTDGVFEITDGVPGEMVDVDATEARINEALLADDGSGSDIAVEAVLVRQEPEVTREQLTTIGDVLGSFSTDFSSSGAARSKNLANGAGKINGCVLMPGETLSGYEYMHPFTTANGYYTAAAYENGMVVDSVGGGVCQIATTLYNAALQAELEITQRQNHSMIVTYVKPSMDAAIAGTYKDIKITNNYSTPVYIEGYTSGKTLTFTIYGKETRPENRKIEYVSETLSRTDPGAPTERLDASLAPGTRQKVQSAHVGLKSRLWKVVRVDGVETERTLLNTDTYNASKAIYLVGPAVPEATVTETVPPTETQGSAAENTEGTENAGAAGGAGDSGNAENNLGVTAPSQAAPQAEAVPQSETTSQAETTPQTETPPQSAVQIPFGPGM
ncbi:MAG: VanW family protein [Clostridiales bacterium]|nr:VanW family protein [Clostridiales bacterium]